MGLETCVTLGKLDAEQVIQLKEAGLDYYSHNLDASPEYYKKIITTRTYEDRLDTLEKIRHAGIKVCCGGILGMGESLKIESYVRLSAGCETMSETMQALCFLVGANSIFYGEKLLVSPNPGTNVDQDFFKRLELEPLIPPELMERTEMGCCADRPCMSE